MPSAEYLPVAFHLPHIYQEDEESFAQIDSYLGLVDDLHRAYLDRLAHLGHWLSPHATDLWPPDLPLDAGRERLAESYLRLFDELASWVAFRFPGSWGRDELGIAKRRSFLLTAARTWRRRGTPRGLIDWFSLAFDLDDDDERPRLVEHFTIAGSGGGSGASADPDPSLRATLFIPASDGWSDVARRREAVAFVQRYAPAHVRMTVCWLAPGAKLPEPPQPGAPATEVENFRKAVRELVCSFVSHTDHAGALHVRACVDEGRGVDRLGLGRLPGGGETPIA